MARYWPANINLASFKAHQLLSFAPKQIYEEPMITIDLNADLGEADNAAWARAEYAMLEYVSSATIACGGHAGTPTSMQHMVRGAKTFGTAIGAHPSYPDKVHFGRRSLVLGDDLSRAALENSLLEQITTLAEIAANEESFISYVKPHGALYNDAVIDPIKADLIVRNVAMIDPALIILGPPNSELKKAAKAYSLNFIAEGFIDRRYTDAGHLQSRSIDGAVIPSQTQRLVQAKKLVAKGVVTTDTGRDIPLAVQSLCLHGDSNDAVDTARLVRREIEAIGAKIEAFSYAP